VLAGTLDLPLGAFDDAPALPEAQTAPPEPTTVISPGVVRIDRLGLELGTERDFKFGIENDDPLTAFSETRVTQTLARGEWRVRIETHIRMSSTRDSFLLQAALRAWEGDAEIYRRDWDRVVARELL
jgi:hypothetical protein